jgi:hypothetical protein
MKCKYIILPVTLFIISCTNNPKRPEHKEFFVTHIETDGTKKFSYSLVTTAPNTSRSNSSKAGGRNGRGGGGRSGRGGKGGNRGGSNQAPGQIDHKLKMEKKFIRKLEKTLFNNAYCLEGYIKLESFIDREMSQLKGQCEEKATTEDKKRFPNQ